MKMTVNAYMMKEIFVKWDRDYYSVNGLDALLEYYDEIDENMEFDPVAICCDCTEYGAHGAACSYTDMINDYGHLVNKDEWMDENALDEFDEDLYLDAIVEALEEQTTVLHICNGNYIVFVF